MNPVLVAIDTTKACTMQAITELLVQHPNYDLMNLTATNNVAHVTIICQETYSNTEKT
jgi:hypothetical protein